MELKNFNRIHIFGSVGSGKTTLVKKLSSKLNIPYYELDNIVWKRNKSGDIRRTEQERKKVLNKIIHSKTWIIEGVHIQDWVDNSFRHADLIIFLDTSYSIRVYRIIKRFILQKLGYEYSNYKPTIKIFFQMFKWNRHFEEDGKQNFYKKYGNYSDKILVIRNKRNIMNLIQ